MARGCAGDSQPDVALPKLGLIGAGEVGELYLAEISVPATVYRWPDLDVPVLR